MGGGGGFYWEGFFEKWYLNWDLKDGIELVCKGLWDVDRKCKGFGVKISFGMVRK